MAQENTSLNEVVFLNPLTCGIYKDGAARYRIDPETGSRTDEIDNQLGEHVDQFLSTGDAPGVVRALLGDVLDNQVLVPRYYDKRWQGEFFELISREGLAPVSLGELEDSGVIRVRGGHGSPSNDNRSGNIPYIKVSDIRSLRINVNPTNLVTEAVARGLWRGAVSGFEPWDLVTPNRASSNIGEFAILLPGDEHVVITKEVFVIRVVAHEDVGWDPYYLLWAFCLNAVRRQWQRVTLMQTNREDVGDRYKEILVPRPRDAEWAKAVSAPFRQYFQTIAKARTRFSSALEGSGFEYIASTHSAGRVAGEEAAPLATPAE